MTEISSYAFENCSALEHVTIPEGVTTIHGDAFSRCTALKDVVLPAGLLRIQVRAFARCTSLERVTIPEGVTTIQFYAFIGCTALKQVTIPASVTAIQYRAFGYLNDREKIDGFTICGYPGTAAQTYAEDNGIDFVDLSETPNVVSGVCGAEGDGSNLTWTLDLDTGLLTIEGCGKMKDYNANDDVFAPRHDYCEIITAVYLPEGLTSIGNCAFYDCNALTSVIIPDSLTTIKWSAFCNCPSMRSVTIPESVTYIESMAFGYYWLNNHDHDLIPESYFFIF